MQLTLEKAIKLIEGRIRRSRESFEVQKWADFADKAFAVGILRGYEMALGVFKMVEENEDGKTIN